MTVWCAYVGPRCFQATARTQEEAQLYIWNQCAASAVEMPSLKSIQPFKVKGC